MNWFLKLIVVKYLSVKYDDKITIYTFEKYSSYYKVWYGLRQLSVRIFTRWWYCRRTAALAHVYHTLSPLCRNSLRYGPAPIPRWTRSFIVNVMSTMSSLGHSHAIVQGAYCCLDGGSRGADRYCSTFNTPPRSCAVTTSLQLERRFAYASVWMSALFSPDITFVEVLCNQRQRCSEMMWCVKKGNYCSTTIVLSANIRTNILGKFVMPSRLPSSP